MKTMLHFLKTTQGKFLGYAGLIIIVLFGYYIYAMPASSTDESPVDIAITAADHVRGAKDGKLTLVEFGDFQCPACGAYEPIVRQVLADNPDTLKISFKHFPLTQLHRNALLAAKASEAASVQGKFWEMHDIIYDKQEEWSESLTARDYFLAYATTLGLDTKKFLTDIDSQAIEDKILAEYKEGIALKVQGTPTFFLNGKKLENVGSLEAFNKAIKDAAAAK
jgi:protein-disulfide isomerase